MALPLPHAQVVGTPAEVAANVATIVTMLPSK